MRKRIVLSMLIWLIIILIANVAKAGNIALVNITKTKVANAIELVSGAITEQETTDENGVTWLYTLDEENATNVKPKDKSTLPESVVIPSTLDGHTVTSIGRSAFESCTSLSSITIPDSVTSIGSKAFDEMTGVVYYPSSIKSLIDEYEGRFSNFVEIALDNIAITTPPSKTVWFEQDVISYYGMIITAIYNDGTSREVTDYEIVNGTNLTVGTTNVTISYTEDGVTKTTTQPMTVLAEMEGENILKEDSEYKIVGVSMIAGVKPKTTIKEFKNEINERYKIAELYEVKDNVMYKVEDENEYVKTDMLIEIREINGFTGFRGALVVTGDCNGSGTANVSDLTKLMISRAESLAQNKDESKILKGAYEKAVDLNGDGKINSVDITRLLMYIAENK